MIQTQRTATAALTNPLEEQADHTSELGRAKMDVGSHAGRLLNDERVINAELESSEQKLLERLESQTGARQITRSELGDMPEWLVKASMDKEVTENWMHVTEEVGVGDMPQDANLLSTHFVFKIKKDEEGERKLKARLVVHGNKDNEIRKDAIAAGMVITRLVMAVGMMIKFTFGVADIKGAYMQSGPFRRDIFIIPPGTYRKRGRVYWKLLALAYGVCDAGRQWLKTSDIWMTRDMGMTRLLGAHQVFMRRGRDGKLELIVAKTTDDFLAAGTGEAVRSFFEKMKERFTVGKSIIENRMNFNGCVIEINPEEGATIGMYDYLNRLSPIDISRNRRKDAEAKATQREIADYRSLAGTLMYLGTSVLPKASLVTSVMQQRINDLRVTHLVASNSMLKDLLLLKPVLNFPPIDGEISSAILTSFSDAAHGGKESDYGQTGGVTGIRISHSGRSKETFYGITWMSGKQRRISHSSFGSEIIAAAEVEERGFDMRETIREIFPQCNIKHEVIVDSRALFDTITTLHEIREYRLRRTVSRIRNSFEAKELDIVRWLPGRENMADALTKRNVQLWVRLNKMLGTGSWIVNEGAGKSHDGSVWV